MHFFFSRLVTRCKTWFELSRVKLYRNDLKGNKNYFELVGHVYSCSLPVRNNRRRVRVTEGKITVKNIKEIQGKSIWVRVGARVRVSEGSNYRESTL